MKILDCFLDGFGSYSCSLVTFEIKTFQAVYFVRPTRDKKILSGSSNGVDITAIVSLTTIKKTTNKKGYIG